MKLKLKANLLDIGTGGPLVVLLDDDTAKKMNVFVGDRVQIIVGKKSTVCTVDIAKNEPQDTVGIFRDAAKVLKVKNKQIVTVHPVTRPASVRAIKNKLGGATLSYEQLRGIINDIASNHLMNVEIAYFVSAAYTRGFSLEEVYNLTKAMIETGSKIEWSKVAVSKHCIGGVSGNRTTMLLVPILAAAGLLMPKTSSRSITSPAGTADTMEVLAPVVVNSVDAVRKIVKEANGCIVWGGALNLAPADDRIIRVEHPLSLDPTPMLLASILAKKKSEGANKVLIDIPVGKYSKVKTLRRFDELELGFVKLGARLGMKIKVMKSKAVAPIGKGIGPVLEARDILWVLKRNVWAPKDLEKKSIQMAGTLLKLGGKAKTELSGRKLARKILDSGMAYEQMKKIIKAQGGDPEVNPSELTLGKKTYTLKATRKGRVVDINDDVVATMAKLAGAPKDKSAGVYLHVALKDKTICGEPLFTIYSNTNYRLEQAKALANKIVKIK